MPTVICQHCGKSFVGKNRKNALQFCSRKCYDAHQYSHVKAKQHTCVACGAVFWAKHAPKYCSLKCKNKSYKQRHKLKCLLCGKEFYSESKSRKYCSRDCVNRQQTIRQIATCKVCGKEFYPKANDRTTCCSRECGFLYLVLPKTKQCQNCGSVFIGSDRQERCDKCVHIYQKARVRRANQIREARKRGVKAERVDIDYLYARDSGKCGICGNKINLHRQYPHPLSMTLDHIVPLANGGEHSNRNCQVAHFICNCKKSNHYNGQMLLIG